MSRLIATQDFPYDGRNLKTGEPFNTTSAEDARILIGVNKAKPAGPMVESKDMRAEDPETDTPQPRRRKRTYGRRDMTAES